MSTRKMSFDNTYLQIVEEQNKIIHTVETVKCKWVYEIRRLLDIIEERDREIERLQALIK